MSFAATGRFSVSGKSMSRKSVAPALRSSAAPFLTMGRPSRTRSSNPAPQRWTATASTASLTYSRSSPRSLYLCQPSAMSRSRSASTTPRSLRPAAASGWDSSMSDFDRSTEPSRFVATSSPRQRRSSSSSSRTGGWSGSISGHSPDDRARDNSSTAQAGASTGSFPFSSVSQRYGPVVRLGGRIVYPVLRMSNSPLWHRRCKRSGLGSAVEVVPVALTAPRLQHPGRRESAPLELRQPLQ